MKIKVESTKTVTTHKEVELPYYSKSSAHFYKLYSETHCIVVTHLEGHESISIRHAGLALGGNNKKSNETEFQKSFDKISKLLYSKI